MEEFTNQFESEERGREKKAEDVQMRDNQNEFAEISSMSYRDEDYEEENEELKLMNLEMIESALKARH